MTPEDLDAFRRADPGYHYDDEGEPEGTGRGVIRWCFAAVAFWCVVALVAVGVMQ